MWQIKYKYKYKDEWELQVMHLEISVESIVLCFVECELDKLYRKLYKILRKLYKNLLRKIKFDISWWLPLGFVLSISKHFLFDGFSEFAWNKVSKKG